MDTFSISGSYEVLPDAPAARSRALLHRSLIGVGLAAAYGMALGTAGGGLHLLTNAVGVPAGILVVLALGLPGLFITLSLFDAPVSMTSLFEGSVRGLESTGMLLGGFAPTVVLFATTGHGMVLGWLLPLAGLFLGGLAGLRTLAASIGEAMKGAPLQKRLATWSAFALFCVFATALAAHVWTETIPFIDAFHPSSKRGT